MKNNVIPLIITMMLLVACTPAATQDATSSTETVLLVTAGDSQKSFSVEDLQALPSSEATFNDVTYKGVTVSALLEMVNVIPGDVRAIKAVAADGYTVNYDPAQVLIDGVLVAYAQADGSSLSTDDGNFRMVLPDEEGKLNVRMLTELKIIQ